MSSDDFKRFIGLAAEGPLSREIAQDAFGIIMDGAATPSQIGGFLMALRRGQTWQPEPLVEIRRGGRFERDGRERDDRGGSRAKSAG